MKRITLLPVLFFLIIQSGIIAQLTSGLIAKFPMNQTITDVHGGHDVVILEKPPTPVIDRHGISECALLFDGTGFGLIEDGIDFSPSFNNPISVSLWFKLNDVNSNWGILFSKYEGISDSKDFSIHLSSEYGLIAEAMPSYLYVNNEFGYTPDLEWHHLLVSIDRYSQKLFLDGQLLRESDHTITGDQLQGNVFIGAGFEGCLDDIYVYDRALDNEDALDLMTVNSECGINDTINNKKITGILFNDLNRNNIKENNEPFLNNFNLIFDPTNSSVNTNSNGFFQTILDKNIIHNLNLSLDSLATWTFTAPQNPFDLSNFPNYKFDLGLIGVHKRPKKEVLLSGTLFSDENGNNVFDGIDTLLPDYNLELAPSNIILTSNSIGYFGYSLDSGDVQTLNIPISE